MYQHFYWPLKVSIHFEYFEMFLKLSFGSEIRSGERLKQKLDNQREGEKEKENEREKEGVGIPKSIMKLDK